MIQQSGGRKHTTNNCEKHFDLWNISLCISRQDILPCFTELLLFEYGNKTLEKQIEIKKFKTIFHRNWVTGLLKTLSQHLTLPPLGFSAQMTAIKKKKKKGTREKTFCNRYYSMLYKQCFFFLFNIKQDNTKQSSTISRNNGFHITKWIQ